MKVFAVILMSVVLSVVATISAFAENSDGVVITAIQTGASIDGTSYASHEFVQIYNNSEEDIDITGWCLKYAASASEGPGNSLACFSPEDDSTRLWLPAKSYSLAVSVQLAEFELPEAVGDITFSAGLAAGGGHVRLIDADNVEVDRVGWGTAQYALGDLAAPAPSNQQVLERKTDELGELLNSGVNVEDFEVVDSGGDYSFGSIYEQGEEEVVDEEIDEVEPEVEPQSETEPEAEPDLNQEGLIITEILPNPDGVDVGNEFIEIYNPNEHEVDLSGYKILVGLNSEKSYSFPAATNVGPLAYLVIYNSEVGFTLVNSTSQVKLQLGEYYNQTDQYENPPAGQAWALIDGVWAYTNRPTPGASNLGFEESLVVSNLKPCADNQYRHPETNRCRLIVSSSSGPTPCRADQERNPETNRCRKIASSSSLTPCKEGQYRSPETNRCRAVLAAQSELKPCAENQYRHPETNRCRKIIEMSDAPHAVEPTKKQTGDTLGFWVLGGIGALAAGYALWEWRGSIFRIFARR